MLRPCCGQDLLQISPSLVGRRVAIRESLRRSRDVGGHDRHVATSSLLLLTIQRVTTLRSGTPLHVDDGALAVPSIVSCYPWGGVVCPYGELRQERVGYRGRVEGRLSCTTQR